jgi:lipopolysaccharide biosynthesis regulator YciM
VARSLKPFFIFVQHFRSSTQQLRTLNKVQYSADGDVIEVTWFQVAVSKLSTARQQTVIRQVKKKQTLDRFSQLMDFSVEDVKCVL